MLQSVELVEGNVIALPQLRWSQASSSTNLEQLNACNRGLLCCHIYWWPWQHRALNSPLWSCVNGCGSGTFLVYLLDEISTGLDSSATYDIVSAFRTFARIRRYTCLFSLLQPSPEVFDLFDRWETIEIFLVQYLLWAFVYLTSACPALKDNRTWSMR